MTTDWPSASARRLCTMRAMTSVPPPGGYGTMKRTGFAGQSSARAARAAHMPSTRIRSFFILNLARCQVFGLGRERFLHAAVLGLDLGVDAARLFGVGAARGRLDVLAIAAQHLRADVRAARFQGMRGARDLGGVARARSLLELLDQLGRLEQVEIGR